MKIILWALLAGMFASSALADTFNLGNTLFLNNTSTAVPVVAGGTSPSVDTRATNHMGKVTFGTGVVASGTITFSSSGYVTWNHCLVVPETVVTSFTYSYTTTVITVAGTSLTGTVVDYICEGQ